MRKIDALKKAIKGINCNEFPGDWKLIEKEEK